MSGGRDKGISGGRDGRSTRYARAAGILLAFALILASTARARVEGEARSVILMIGDGMGLAQRTLAYYALGHQPSMNTMPVVGLMSTEPAPSDPHLVDVTDSAAAATALACGIKTYNDAIGVDLARMPVPTILEAAAAAGRSTGLVVTCQVNHATPACFAAHDEARDHYDAIAVDYLTSHPDVILGGGTDYFLPEGKGGARKDGRDLEFEFKQLGYALAHSKAELSAITRAPVLGLFASKGFAPVVDRDLPASGDLLEPAKDAPHPSEQQPTLVDMTEKAIELLSRDQDGFFLMIEGSQIDWGCHGNDAPYALHETVAFDQAVAAARAFAAKDRHTLVVVLADHETGGLALGRDYSLNVELLNGIKASCGRLGSSLEAAPDRADELLRVYAGIDSLSADERDLLASAKRKSEAVAKIVSGRVGLVWGSHDHSGALIPVTADGADASLFEGVYENSDVPIKIARAMGISFRPHRSN